MPSSSNVAYTSAGAVSTKRSLCSTSSTAWRSAAVNARGGVGRTGAAAGAARRRR